LITLLRFTEVNTYTHIKLLYGHYKGQLVLATPVNNWRT